MVLYAHLGLAFEHSSIYSLISPIIPAMRMTFIVFQLLSNNIRSILIASTMLSIDYKKPSPRVRWSLRNRTVLCCMFRFFRKDKDAFRRIFESLFADDLRNFDHGLPYSTLNTQWAHLQRYGDPVWHRVHVCIAFPASGPWLSVLSSIKDRAFSLGLSLVEKQVDNIDTSTFRLNPNRHRNRRDLSLETHASSPSSAQSSPSSSSPSSSSQGISAQSEFSGLSDQPRQSESPPPASRSKPSASLHGRRKSLLFLS